MQYLMVENPGIVGIDMLRILGASSSRDNERRIGQFGSGFKFSIALLLRYGLDLQLFIGRDAFNFSWDERLSNDVKRDRVIREVTMRQFAGSSSKKTPLGYDLTFGMVNWTDVGMAIREIISNAVDACYEQNLPVENVKIQFVEESEVKKKDNHTRVFVQLNPEIESYIRTLSKHFILFKSGYDPDETIVHKTDPTRGAWIYRRGVRVGKVGMRSIFDYNLPNVPIDESRKIDESSAREAICSALDKASFEIMVEFFETLKNEGEEYVEYKLDPYFFNGNNENWANAFYHVYGKDAVACESPHAFACVQNKGMNAVLVSNRLGSLLRKFKIRCSNDVLDHFAQSGRTQVEIPQNVKDRCHWIWNKLESLKISKGKDFPAILEGFQDVTESSGRVKGYFQASRNAVGLSTQVIESEGSDSFQTIIEEFGHAITDAGDYSAVLQEWLGQVAALLMYEAYKKEHSHDEDQS